MNTVIRNVLLGGLLWLTIPLAAQVSQDVIDKAKAAGMTEDQIRQEIAKRMGQSGAEQVGSKASEAVISDRAVTTKPGQDSISPEEQRQMNLPENDLKQTVFGREIFSNKNLSFEPDLNIPIQIEEEAINETVNDSVENSPKNKFYIKWSNSYKEAHKLIYSKESTLEDYKKAENLLLSEYKNVLALYDLGKLYSMEKSGLKDDEKSFEFYEKALHGFIQIEPKVKKIKPYLQYQIGVMYFKGLGSAIDNQKAAEYFEKSAELGNQYAKRMLALEYISGENFEYDIKKGISMLTECADNGDVLACYKLGKFYLFGTENIQKDMQKAIQYLNFSAEQGNECAQNILNNQEKFENEMLADTILGLFVNLSRCIEDDYHRQFQSGRKMIDSKLRRMIQEKNRTLGIKQEYSQTQDY